MDRTAEEILDDLRETGEMPKTYEVEGLCVAAREGDWALAKLEALERTLRRAGWSVVDTTTDDDESMVIELLPPEEAA